MSHLRCSAICLTPAARQDEFWASQYPDGSIVFSVMLKGERVQYLLVPPGRIAARRSTKLTAPGRSCGHDKSRDGAFPSHVRSPALEVVCEPCGRHAPPNVGSRPPFDRM